MEDIGNLIKKATRNLNSKSKFHPNYQAALENEEVKKFLAANQTKITAEIV